MTAPIAGAQWTFVPAAELRAVYSDNINLQPDGEETADLVGVLTPGFSLQREDDAFTLGLDYSLQAVGYLDSDDANQIFQQIDGRLNAELLEDHLFVNASGALFQQVADPENPFIQNNVVQTGNRTDTIAADLGVTWLQSFGDFAALELSHSESILEFDLPQLIDSQISSTRGRLSSPQTGEGLTWSLSANLDRVEFNDPFPEAEFSTALAEIGYWVGTNLRVFVNGGVESDYLEHRNRIEYDTPIWTAGLDWQVAERDQLTLSFGERVFGTNLNFNWVHRLGEKLELRVAYTELPSTNPQSARNQVQALEELLDLESLDGLEGLVGLNQPGTADSFVRRRASAGINANGNRLSFGFNAFREERTDRVNAFGVPVDADDEESFGGFVFARWSAGVKTQIEANARWEQAEFLTGVETDRLTLTLALDYTLG
ncbi:MAG: TIGR03016 family PEP-CTERM system-associated outer membrane protein, partial [Pseudomonadota bacterium]